MNTRWKSLRRVVVKTACVLVVLWLLGCGALYITMLQPPETFAGVMAKMPGPVPFLLFPFETMWTHARAGKLRVGDPVPDFSLQKQDKSGEVQLSALNRQKPVVLIFGSYT